LLKVVKLVVEQLLIPFVPQTEGMNKYLIANPNLFECGTQSSQIIEESLKRAKTIKQIKFESMRRANTCRIL